MPLAVVAPNAFTGSISAAEAATALAHGFRAEGWQAVECPVADGGPGTRVLLAGRVPPGVSVVESAEYVVPFLDPLGADTFELGRAVMAAPGEEVWIGLGGSRSTDGGTGLARAMGWRFLDRRGRELSRGGGSLADLSTAVPPRRSPGRRLVGLRDVDVALLDAPRVFGPQKGAGPAEVDRLEAGLRRLVEVTGVPGDFAGAGAAGGLGYGVVVFGGGRIERGVEVVAGAVGLDAALSGADLCVTGEGSVDAQTLTGKAPAFVAQRAGDGGVPLALVGGRVDAEVAGKLGARTWVALSDLGPDPMERAAAYLEVAGRQIARRR